MIPGIYLDLMFRIEGLQRKKKSNDSPFVYLFGLHELIWLAVTDVATYPITGKNKLRTSQHFLSNQWEVSGSFGSVSAKLGLV